MLVTVDNAKVNLSKLIEATLAGEEVVIARGGAPVVRLVAIKRRRFRFGVLENQLDGELPDFLQPASEDSLAAWEEGR